jgi:hypothetical protein
VFASNIAKNQNGNGKGKLIRYPLHWCSIYREYRYGASQCEVRKKKITNSDDKEQAIAELEEKEQTHCMSIFRAIKAFGTACTELSFGSE